MVAPGGAEHTTANPISDLFPLRPPISTVQSSLYAVHWAMMKPMAERRWVTRRSYGVLVTVLLLVAAIGSTALHWHSDWNDQQCQLCHVRNTPAALGSVAPRPLPALTQREWLPENPFSELEVFSIRLSSRAPPASITFTV